MSPSFILCKRTIVLNVFILFFFGGVFWFLVCFCFVFLTFRYFFFFTRFFFMVTAMANQKMEDLPSLHVSSFFCIEKTTTHTHRYKVTHTHSHIWEEVKSNVHRRFFFITFFRVSWILVIMPNVPFFFLNTIPLFLCVPLVDSYTVVVLFSIYLLVSFFGGEKKKKCFPFPVFLNSSW